MIEDKIVQGFEEGILALAYGVPLDVYHGLLAQQEQLEEYEFCAGMKKALEVWNDRKGQLNCKATPRTDEES